jgi:ribokinase
MVVRVPTHPRPGENALGHKLRTLPAGKGANHAVAAARAGATVRLIGCVGKDEAGGRYLARLRRLGVDVTAVQVVVGVHTGTVHITVDDMGENSIIVVPGANSTATAFDVDQAAAFCSTRLLPIDLPRDLLKIADPVWSTSTSSPS